MHASWVVLPLPASGSTRAEAMDSERLLSVQLALFSAYPLREWAENKTHEQSTASERPKGHTFV